MLTGSCVFNIKPSSFNKLKNLHKHSNIHGYTFKYKKNRNCDIYEIIGSE